MTVCTQFSYSAESRWSRKTQSTIDRVYTRNVMLGFIGGQTPTIGSLYFGSIGAQSLGVMQSPAAIDTHIDLLIAVYSFGLAAGFLAWSMFCLHVARKFVQLERRESSWAQARKQRDSADASQI